MTRDEFLQQQWTPYPHPPASYWRSQDWVFGKIAQKNGASIRLVGLEPAFETSSQLQGDTSLGKAIPSKLLRENDAVAYQRTTGAVFLLSPNLAPSADVPSVQGSRRDAMIQWQLFLETVRRYFHSQGFRHWQTPTLLVSPGIDAHIDFFAASGIRSQRSYFLPTSPEFALKKALADGETKIFEIKACFRDDDSSPTHSAEFLMLEWYRAYADKWELLEDFLGLVRFVAHEMNLDLPPSFSVKKTSMAELFRQKINLQLHPETSRQELLEVLQKHNLHWGEGDDWDDLFFRLYIEFIEPTLGAEGPQAVYNFPFSQGSLSRKTQDGWADRFEIYWEGLELANAYQEQNDPAQMQSRYDSEIEKRKNAHKTPHPQDSEFLSKMREGFPPCAGIALGLERLWMVLNQIPSIQSLRT
jgi:elongation factor P--(R)-beta-lysine ligase